MPAVGRIGLIIDPQGAALGLFAPAGDDPPANPPPGAGTAVWHELATTDHEAAFRFYEQTLRLVQGRRDGYGRRAGCIRCTA